MKPKQRKYTDPSSQSIVERAWNGIRDFFGFTIPPTYTDGYGNTRNAETPFWEGAQGQELKRMGQTAKITGKIGLIATGFINPYTVSSLGTALLGTIGNAYGLSLGAQNIYNTGKQYIQNPSSVSTSQIISAGLDAIPFMFGTKNVLKNFKTIKIPNIKNVNLNNLKYKTSIYEDPANNEYTIALFKRGLRNNRELGTLILGKNNIYNGLDIKSVSNLNENYYKGIGEELYNRGIELARNKGYSGIISGKTLVHPEKTITTTSKYKKKLIGETGMWISKDPLWQGNNKPVYLLEEPTQAKYKSIKLRTNKNLQKAIKNNTYLINRIDQQTLNKLGVYNIDPENLRNKLKNIPIEFGNTSSKGGAYYSPVQNKIIIGHNAPKSMYGEMIDHERLHAFDWITKNSSNRYSGDVSVVLGTRPLYQKELENTGIFTSELAAKLVQLKNKAKLNKNTFISGDTWKNWVTNYKSNLNYNGIKELDKVIKDWDKLAKWADKAVPAISPMFIPKFIWNGNDNTQMNNAD